jgi:hypothetical protein
MQVIPILFWQLLILSSLSAAQAEGPAIPPRGGICENIREIPLIHEIRAEAAVVAGKATALNGAITKLQTDCTAYKANPQQTGSLFAAMQQNLRETARLAGEFNGKADSLLAQKATAVNALRLLSDQECLSRLEHARGELNRQKQDFTTRARAACDLSAQDLDKKLNRFGTRDQRAERAASLTSSDSMSRDRVRNAILNPRANRADSQVLLRQADEYARSRGLPVASVNSRDTICGERCVALLRAQRAEQAYGANSPQYQRIRQQAVTTKFGLFGDLLFDPDAENVGT